MSGHTPGPYQSRFDRDSRTMVVESLRFGSACDELAIVHNPTSDREGEQIQAANAALLASAPDLLAERDRLREALKQIATGEGVYGLQAHEHKQIARAALQDTNPSKSDRLREINGELVAALADVMRPDWAWAYRTGEAWADEAAVKARAAIARATAAARKGGMRA